MAKKIGIIGLLLMVIAGSAAFGQVLRIGLDAALFTDDLDTLEEQFEDGSEFFIGPRVEIFLGRRFGLAGVLLFNKTEIEEQEDTRWDTDLAINIHYHLFGKGRFIDPFIEGGIGARGYHFDEAETEGFGAYMHAGAGIGVNLFGLGIHALFSRNFEMDTETEEDVERIPIEDWKFTLSAKMTLF